MHFPPCGNFPVVIFCLFSTTNSLSAVLRGAIQGEGRRNPGGKGKGNKRWDGFVHHSCRFFGPMRLIPWIGQRKERDGRHMRGDAGKEKRKVLILFPRGEGLPDGYRFTGFRSPNGGAIRSDTENSPVCVVVISVPQFPVCPSYRLPVSPFFPPLRPMKRCRNRQSPLIKPLIRVVGDWKTAEKGGGSCANTLSTSK